MVPEQDEKRLIYIVAREILLSIILIVIVTVIALGMTFPSMFYLSRSLQKYFLETKFKSLREDSMSFYDIKTAADFWSYSEIVIANCNNNKYRYNVKQAIRATEYFDNILYQNYLIGGIRIRQLKVRNNSCPIHDYMVRNFHVCFAAFSKKAEDKANFGEQKGTAWAFNNPKEAPAVSYYGMISIYPAGGYYSVLKNTASLVAISNLKEKLWLTKGTRLIIYEFSVYNGNVNLLCAVKLAFEFPSSGGVLPSASFKTVRLFRYSSIVDFFVLALELIYMGFVVLFIVEEIIEMRFFGRRYFENCWNWVDLSIVILSITVLCLRIHREILLLAVLKDDSNYPNYEQVADLQMKIDYVIAFLLSFFILKLFKYLEYSPVLGQLNLTLKKCAKNVTGFAVMFFIVFLAYAELGYLLFGTQVLGFAGFYPSMITLTRTIMGDFNYEEIEASDTLYAPIYFLSYIFVVFFVLMNMFIAIVNDAYAEVKVRESVIQRTKRGKIYTLGVYKFFRMVGLSVLIPRSERHPNSICLTVYEVETTLRGCGFNKDDIDKVLKQCGFNTEHKTRYINHQVQNVDRKLYSLPLIPETPEKLGTVQDGTTLISYQEFLRTEEKIKEIQDVLEHLTTKLDFLINQFPKF